MDNVEKAREVYDILDTNSSKDIEFLKFNNPFELLISVILSAQTTDNQVNKVTPSLFQLFPTPEALASASLSEVETIIHSTGFYKNKAKNIISAAEVVMRNFANIVPLDMSSLLTIPGVGRKTANVIIGRIAHKGAIIVDTHFLRVVNRLGLVHSKDPYTIELQIKELMSEEKQYRFSMTVNLHGRRVCLSRTPSCSSCLLSHLCDYLMITGVSSTR